MPPESKKFLFDIQRAADRVVRFTAGKSADQYASEEMLRSAVERQFEIIGEALGKLMKVDSTTANKISEQRRIISFRNVLIHGYDSISDAIVWDIVEKKLPILIAEVQQLLAEPE